ncbi:hypothetical protein GGE65_007108 [Skermanella aerolata]|uniref:ImmA/IrrE family metallo-endopeptidase n=1 Tax=Skermanella aerolata TaxID=393310 RepID=UPI003D23288B
MTGAFLAFSLIILSQKAEVPSSNALRPEDFKLRSANRLLPLVEEAVAIVNRVLATDIPVRLTTPGAEIGRPGVATVPVLLVRPDGARFSDSTVALATPEFRAIVVGETGFENFTHAVSDQRGYTASIASRDLLAFVLMHELGHILAGHRGAFWDSQTVDRDRLNLDASLDKTHEEEADAFVAAQMNGALADTGDFDRWMTTMRVSIALSELSFNLAAIRRVECFGCSVLRDIALFWDRADSHPNFEYRVLQLNHRIQNNQTSKSLLEEFETVRRLPHGASSPIVANP